MYVSKPYELVSIMSRDCPDRFQSRNCSETNYSEMYVSKPYELVSIMADIALIDSENVYY